MAVKGSMKVDVAGDLTEEEQEMDFDPIMRGIEMFGQDFKADPANAEPGLTAYRGYDEHTDLDLVVLFDQSGAFVKLKPSRHIEVFENTLHI